MISKVYEFQEEIWEQFFLLIVSYNLLALLCTGIYKHNTTCITQCCRERIAIQQHRLTGEF